MSATVHHGDNREWLATLDDDSFDVLTSDPPFAEETHKGARFGGNGEVHGIADFAAISFPALRDTLALAGTKVRRWVVVHTDVGHAVALRDNPPVGLRFVRIGAWVKPNGAPQFTGDRPAMGWEAMAWLHRDGGRMTWNGGGRDAVFIVPRVTGTNKTTKPLKLCRDLLSLITDGSGAVLDPWCGEGKYGVAAVERGLGYAGCDIDPVMVQIARDALSATSAQPDLFTRTKPKQGALEL